MKKIGLIVVLFALIVSGVARTQSNTAPWASYSTWYDHTCALTTAGKAYCWGSNNYGKLGIDKKNDYAKVPMAVATNLAFSSISAGVNHTCAIATDGKTYCWGDNGRAQLGVPAPDRAGKGTDQSVTPVMVQTDQKFSSISAGFAHTCALTAEGKAYCWGSNFNGEIGSDSGNSENPTPLAVKGKLVFASIQAGRTTTCGLIASGEAYCWGSNSFGKFGNGSEHDEFTPTRAGGELLFSSLTVGELHVCGVTKDNIGYCWGRNTGSKLGSGPGMFSDSTIPVLIAGGLKFKSVSASRVHSCALTTTNQAWCWGSGASGQLGVGVPDGESPKPVAANTKLVFVSIQVGNAFTCAMTADKNIYCWGANDNGQLGNDSTKNSVRPEQVETP